MSLLTGQSSMTGPIHVTGLGTISAIGCNTVESLNALREGRSGIGRLTLFDSVHQDQLPVGEVKRSNMDLKQLAGLNSELTCSRTTLLGLIAAREAFERAGLEKTGTLRMGLISGTSVGGMDCTERFFTAFHQDRDAGFLRDVIDHDCGAGTELIADRLGVKGYLTTISTACSSAANAIMLGGKLIRSGRLDCVIAGGCDSLVKFTLNGFASLKILDSRETRPFDEDRAGLNLGEGAGFLVLQSEKSLSVTGKEPLCRLSGYANTCDAFHQTASSPEGEGAYQAMEKAVKQAGLKPADIDYLNAHGTGTRNNDLSEAKAMDRLFGADMPPFGSTKPFTGHTLGAAGGVEAVFSCLSILEKIIYSNLHWKTAMKELPLEPVKSSIDGQTIHHVLSNSFGFGGNDTTLVFSKNV